MGLSVARVLNLGPGLIFFGSGPLEDRDELPVAEDRDDAAERKVRPQSWLQIRGSMGRARDVESRS